jgi:hypothetical protein
MATTYKYCADCEKLLNLRNKAQDDVTDASVFRASTDAGGHIHRPQQGTCDTCGQSKEVTYYGLSSEG